ncbi:MAG TPA: peptide chain release factor 1, partial [Marinilabiliaceae bacterium]|nr:peptide chain release factor 1 [Marinilabiliaceae bacterium]
MDNSLLNKLEHIRLRFEEIGTQITDPEVISDTKRYIKLNKEYKDLEDLVGVSKEYKNLLENISNTRHMLKDEKDEEMREMAKAELDEMEDKLPELEEE